MQDAFSVDLLGQYASDFSTPESTLLKTIQTETRKEVPGAHMLSGHLQGRMLAAFSQMIQPRAILEVGTYVGYSTLCLLEGLAADGLLYTIDNNRALEARARCYFQQHEKGDQIRFYLGEALEVVPQIAAFFDLIFIDADKKNYDAYYELGLAKLVSGGFMVIDNVLWGGKVLIEETRGKHVWDRRTRNMAYFNKKVQQDPRTTNVLVPVRDGLMVVRKNEK